jgi:transposase
MVTVMIGVDPHKASHTAVVISAAEEPLGELRVRACAVQVERLLAWAQAWPQRAWAVEGAGGVGHLLAQQLLAAGERVLDVPPKLAARVRLLATGDTNKNDPNDARSVAVAALRSAGVREARRDDHAAVLKIWSKRYRDLGRTRTQVACRLHAVLCELIPGGVSTQITAGQATHILGSITPPGAVEAARCELAAEFTEDLRGIDAAIRETRKKLTVAIRAAGTSLTGLFGVGRSSPPRSSATSARCPASPAGITSRPTTAPRRSRCPQEAARSTGCPGAATGGSTTPSTWPRLPRSATPTARAAPTTSGRSPRERPRKRPCAA